MINSQSQWLNDNCVLFTHATRSPLVTWGPCSRSSFFRTQAERVPLS